MENLKREHAGRGLGWSQRRVAKIAVAALSAAVLGTAGLSGAMAQDDGAYPGGSGTGIFGEDWPFPNGGSELIVDDWPFPHIPAPGSGGGGISVGGSGGGDINVGGSSGGTITMGGGGGGISIGGGSSGSGSGGGSGSGAGG